ncbi:MAG: hypothetical protein EXX96DRAFT_22735 [Benjaminiella poitrasii]|nr:MAG: hypothetical protein EXX96DRAFT_22735 [Benjaminiella poitrasii]
MKSVRLQFKRKFDDQYSLTLQNNLSIQDFQWMLGLFNQAAHLRPPPGPSSFWIGSLVSFWISIVLLFYLLWLQFHHIYLVAALLPTFIILVMLHLMWLHRYKCIKFEENILEICSRLNATENIRGIHFRFIKNNVEVTPFRINSSLSTFNKAAARYTVVIEFDDRFIALKNQQRRTSFSSATLIDSDETISMPKTTYKFDEKRNDDNLHDMFHSDDNEKGYIC